jgi:hypothetical protein
MRVTGLMHGLALGACGQLHELANRANWGHTQLGVRAPVRLRGNRFPEPIFAIRGLGKWANFANRTNRHWGDSDQSGQHGLNLSDSYAPERGTTSENMKGRA